MDGDLRVNGTLVSVLATFFALLVLSLLLWMYAADVMPIAKIDSDDAIQLIGGSAMMVLLWGEWIIVAIILMARKHVSWASSVLILVAVISLVRCADVATDFANNMDSVNRRPRAPFSP